MRPGDGSRRCSESRSEGFETRCVINHIVVNSVHGPFCSVGARRVVARNFEGVKAKPEFPRWTALNDFSEKLTPLAGKAGKQRFAQRRSERFWWGKIQSPAVSCLEYSAIVPNHPCIHQSSPAQKNLSPFFQHAFVGFALSPARPWFRADNEFPGTWAKPLSAQRGVTADVATTRDFRSFLYQLNNHINQKRIL